MRCSDRRPIDGMASRVVRAARRCRQTAGKALLSAALGPLLAAPTLAHKASDAYLRIDDSGSGLSVRWDIALRDLDVALDLDVDADGRLTWGEIRPAWPRIEAYALQHLSIGGCPLQPASRGLERRNDGAYAALRFTSGCHLAAAPTIVYTLFRDVDPTHRGIARIQLAGRPLELVVLDPAQPAAGPAARAMGASESSPPSTPRAADAPDADMPTRADRNRTDSASTWRSGFGFAREGVRHILTGYDHVLFLLCLLLPSVMRRTSAGWRPVERLAHAVWPVVGIVSAFTIAHSITLGLAATGIVSLSPAFIEPAIAVTIVLAALDNVWPVFPVRRVVVTFCFGLIHGFGFASVLRELDLPTARFAWALLQFNVGLEFGQLLIVVAVTAVLFGLRNRRRYADVVIRGGSCTAILIGAMWIVERVANVSLLGG